MKRIYLDYAATTPVEPQVVKAMEPFFNRVFGNPSSLHWFGQEAQQATEEARAKVAHLIGAQAAEIVFTSGGTEADNLALKGIAYALKERGNHIITSTIEHHAVLNPCKFLEKQGFRVTYLPVDKDGLVDPEDVRKSITDQTILVSIMHANNEIGTIQPIQEISKLISEFRKQKVENRSNKDSGFYFLDSNFPLFHSDAVQTVGHLPINVNDLGVDLLSISAHKLYGPKGVGALYLRRGVKLEPLLHGGEQENNRRASTENLAGIVGFGKACEIAEGELDSEGKRLKDLHDYLIKNILEKIPGSRLNGHPTRRLPNNVNVSIEGVEGESMLVSLDMVGVAVSTGSACSSKVLEPSHVLMAMGLSPEVAHSSLRFSLGKETTKKDLDYTISELVKIVKRLQKISPLKSR